MNNFVGKTRRQNFKQIYGIIARIFTRLAGELYEDVPQKLLRGTLTSVPSFPVKPIDQDPSFESFIRTLLPIKPPNKPEESYNVSDFLMETRPNTYEAFFIANHQPTVEEEDAAFKDAKEFLVAMENDNSDYKDKRILLLGFFIRKTRECDGDSLRRRLRLLEEIDVILGQNVVCKFTRPSI
jgi:hypothetical protein